MSEICSKSPLLDSVGRHDLRHIYQLFCGKRMEQREVCSLLSPPPVLPEKKTRETFHYRNISGEGINFYTSFVKIQKNRRRVKLQAVLLHSNSKTIDLQRVKTVIIFGGMVFPVDIPRKDRD